MAKSPSKRELIRDLGLDKLDGDPDERAEDLQVLLRSMNDEAMPHDREVDDLWIQYDPDDRLPVDQMELANAIIGGYGVEAGFDAGDNELSTSSGRLVMEYVNTGDTYNATVVRDVESNETYIGTWGDFVEQWEQGRDEYDDDDGGFRLL